MVDDSGSSIDVETQYIAMHCEATRGVRDTCWEMPRDTPKVKREKLNLFQWFTEFRGMFTGDPITLGGKLLLPLLLLPLFLLVVYRFWSFLLLLL